MITLDTKNQFQQNYKMLIGSIIPRPIAVISTLNEDGSNNIAPFSFFTAVSANPMIIGFSPMIRTSTGELKDTPKNIFREKEFVVNFATESNAEKVNKTSLEMPYGEDESILSKLKMLDSLKVKARRVEESPIHFECIFRDSLSYGDHVGAGQFITGEVVQIHINKDMYQDSKVVTKKVRQVGRGAGLDWIRCNDVFELERLMKAQIQK